MTESIWTKKKVAKLEVLWKKDLPLSEIGKELGVSRNSIAGKASRLGLQKRRSPIGTDTETKPKQAESRTRSIHDMDPGDLPLKLALRTIDWSHTNCSWPIGDPKTNEFRFCGEDVVQGKPYCNAHCFDAYTTGRESGGS